MTYFDVECFLKDFKEKLDVFDVVFEDDREKNKQAIYDLDIKPGDRKNYLKKLSPENYSEGPCNDEYDSKRPDFWVFGMNIKDREVYIKINMGMPGKRVICISFHVAEYPMNYPTLS